MVKELEKTKEKALNLACGTSVDYSSEKVQTSSGNSMERKFANYANYSKEIDECLAESYRVKAEILDAIKAIQDNKLETLLIAWYINDAETWEDVARILSYDVRNVHRLHKKALKKIGEVIKPLLNLHS